MADSTKIAPKPNYNTNDHFKVLYSYEDVIKHLLKEYRKCLFREFSRRKSAQTSV